MHTVTREAEKGFYMFLEAERLRHLQDVRHIRILMQEVENEQKLSFSEITDLRMRAKRYVEIKEYKG